MTFDLVFYKFLTNGGPLLLYLSAFLTSEELEAIACFARFLCALLIAFGHGHESG